MASSQSHWRRKVSQLTAFGFLSAAMILPCMAKAEVLSLDCDITNSSGGKNLEHLEIEANAVVVSDSKGTTTFSNKEEKKYGTYTKEYVEITPFNITYGSIQLASPNPGGPGTYMEIKIDRRTRNYVSSWGRTLFEMKPVWTGLCVKGQPSSRAF